MVGDWGRKISGIYVDEAIAQKMEVSRKHRLSSRNIKKITQFPGREKTMEKSQTWNQTDVYWGPMNIYICYQGIHLFTAYSLKTSLYHRIVTLGPKRLRVMEDSPV